MYCCYKHIHCKHVFTQLDKETRCCTKKTLLSLPAKNLNYHLISWEYINQRQRFFFCNHALHGNGSWEYSSILPCFICHSEYMLLYIYNLVTATKTHQSKYRSPSCYKYYTGKYSSHVPIRVYLPKCISKSKDRMPFR